MVLKCVYSTVLKSVPSCDEFVHFSEQIVNNFNIIFRYQSKKKIMYVSGRMEIVNHIRWDAAFATKTSSQLCQC